MTKRTLVTISHAIEQAAVMAADDAPMIVFAMFQHGTYFERERDVYSRIAKASDATVVGGTGLELALPAAGVDLVPLNRHEALAREWSVVVLTPRFGAVLVAQDVEQVAAATTLEAGRLFNGQWHFRRDEALHEAARLRRTLADRLSASTLAAVDAVLDRARFLPSTAGEVRAEASIRLFAQRLERREQIDARPPRPAGGQPELDDEAQLRSWAGADGITASGMLPVALIGIRLIHPDGLPRQMTRRTETMATIEVIRAVTAMLRPVDRAVRLGGDDLALTLPAVTHGDAVATAERLVSEIVALRGRHLYVPDVTCVVLVTRDRPLPLDRIRAGLDWGQSQRIPIATLGDSERSSSTNRHSATPN